jgi:hypothetical protein
MRSFILFLISFISVSSTTPLIGVNKDQTNILNKTFEHNQTKLNIKSCEKAKEINKKIKNKKRSHNNDKSVNRRAVWGFIFGLASVVIFPILAIPGLIFSNDALREERAHPRILTKTNRTLAILGKIFSIIGIAIIIIAIIYMAFLLAFLTAWG